LACAQILSLHSHCHSSIVPAWGRVISRPEGLDHNAGPSAIPCGSSQSWILNGNLRDFFTNLAISSTVALSISVGYRPGFPTHCQEANKQLFKSMFCRSSWIFFLPPPRDCAVTSRMRSAWNYPCPVTRTVHLLYGPSIAPFLSH